MKGFHKDDTELCRFNNRELLKKLNNYCLLQNDRAAGSEVSH